MNCLSCDHEYVYHIHHMFECGLCDCKRAEYPTLNSPVPEAGGACAVDSMRALLNRVENDPDCPEALIRLAPLVQKTLDAVAIPEVETIQ